MADIDLSRSNDYRNVTDEFKSFENDEIRAALDGRRGKLVTILQNLSHDFNKGTAIRNTNAFSGRKVIFLNSENRTVVDSKEGVKKYDTRGAVGAHHYEHIEHHVITDFQTVFDELHGEGYTIFAVDNIPEYNPENVFDVEFPEKSAFVFGEEQLGLADDIIKAADRMIYLPQSGSVRSLNVSVAHGIIMAFYTKQHRYN
ncbi:RNA methyltransferase [Weissella oryzae SG25]|uniref:RNA methyltransferase n=1 Tax=Weissella oryzae (strain DSM 25784 / JCM 18191 / LMG 30913 / SG25) TaxID=1329250 RepID=A0A069CUL3_WEIOS|nr:TrmH family RNA methyltransferase [Weissella oryzae]GAK31495.1 RNA methyltransferase [Weissella oryzae SG25]